MPRAWDDRRSTNPLIGWSTRTGTGGNEERSPTVQWNHGLGVSHDSIQMTPRPRDDRQSNNTLIKWSTRTETGGSEERSPIVWWNNGLWSFVKHGLQGDTEPVAPSNQDKWSHQHSSLVASRSHIQRALLSPRTKFTGAHWWVCMTFCRSCTRYGHSVVFVDGHHKLVGWRLVTHCGISWNTSSSYFRSVFGFFNT